MRDLIICLAFAGAACSAPPPQSALPPNMVLSIRGEGEIKRAPNVAFIEVRSQVHRPTGTEAMKAQAEQTAKVLAALKARGVADADMQTTNLSLSPSYVYVNKERKRTYYASNSIRVQARDLPKLGELLDAVVDAGGEIDYGLSFDIDGDGGAKAEARTAAVKNAQEKAEAYAKATGHRVVRMVSLTEPGVSKPNFAPQREVLMAQAMPVGVDFDVPPTPIQTGQVVSHAEIDASFELEKLK